MKKRGACRPVAASLAILACLTVMASCARPPVTPVDFAVFQGLGEVGGEALSSAARSILMSDRGFELARSSRAYSALYMETSWRARAPFADEEASGVTEARSRLIIRGQRRSSGAYEAVLEGENEVRTDSTRTWHGAPVSPSFRAWIDEIAEQLREEAGS